MQLLPETGRAIALRTGGDRFVVSDLLDPEINVRYGSWYLRDLLDRYDDARTALAAYHAGQGNVDRWRARGVGVEFPETRAYVERVQRLSGSTRALPGRARSLSRNQRCVDAFRRKRKRIPSPPSNTSRGKEKCLVTSSKPRRLCNSIEGNVEGVGEEPGFVRRAAIQVRRASVRARPIPHLRWSG